MTMSSNVDVMTGAAEVAALVRLRAPEIDNALPADVVDALLAAGMYRLCLPSELGGLDAGLGAVAEAVETLAMADGSVGWCVGVANASASLLGGLDPSAAEVVASDPARLCIAGGFAATGRAIPVGEMVEVSGRWSFASGCTAANWMLGGAFVLDGDGTRRGAPIVAFFPAAEATIVPNWDVVGLRATGSHDVVADAVIVPSTRTCTLAATRWSSDPVARIPFFTLGAILTSATVLGIAERALDEIRELAPTKVHFTRQTPLAQEEPFQQELTDVTGATRAARNYLFRVAEDVERAASHGVVTTALQAEAFMVARVVRDAAMRSVTFAHEAAGTTAIRRSSPLSRCLADVLVAACHIGFSRTPAGAVGRFLLGQGPQPPVLT